MLEMQIDECTFTRPREPANTWTNVTSAQNATCTVEILNPRSLYSKVQVHLWTYICGILSMSSMSCMHACALSWHLQLSLQWPSSWRDYASAQLKPYVREINYICHTSPSWYALWSKKTNKQTNKQTNRNSHSSLCITLHGMWAGKEYYRSLRIAIHINTEIRILQKDKWSNH